MEVMRGYQQTDVGTIPEDWKVATVGGEFYIQLGKMLDTEKNVGVPKPFLGNRAVQWGRIDLSDIGAIKLTPSDLHRFRLRDGDLLVCEGGEIGRAAIWRQPIEECYYQKALHRLRPKRGYNVALMLNILQRFASTGFLQNFVTQTSIAHLPKDKFEKVPIPFPPTKAEQEAIADALNDADALIVSLERLLSKKRHLKQGAMQELLTGKKRMAGFNGKWKSIRLGEFAPLQRGFDLPASHLQSGPYPVVYSNGILNHHFRYQVAGPEIVTGRSGTIGNVHFVEQNYWPHNTTLTRADVAKFHHDLRHIPYQANRCLEIISKMFSLAEMWGLRSDGSNPRKHIKKYAEEKRERFLSPAELKRVGEVLREMESEGIELASGIAAARLLILTGCRLSEIMTLQWEHVDISGKALRLPDSKTGAKVVHLGQPAVEILRKVERVEKNPWVIVGTKPSARLTDLQPFWQRVRARAGLKDVRIHDLRHTFASTAVAAGQGLPMIGKLLGHTQVQTTARYAHLAADPIKLAANHVSAEIAILLNGRTASGRATDQSTDTGNCSWVEAATIKP